MTTGRYFYNSTPPRMWPIVKSAAERGWTVTIRRAAKVHLVVLLERDKAPTIKAAWDFCGDVSPAGPGRWKLRDVTVSRGFGDPKPMQANLSDIPRLIAEAGDNR